MFAVVDEIHDDFETLRRNARRKFPRKIGEVIDTTEIDDRVIAIGLQGRQQSGVLIASWMQHQLLVRTSQQGSEKGLGCDLGRDVSLAVLGVDIGHVQP